MGHVKGGVSNYVLCSRYGLYFLSHSLTILRIRYFEGCFDGASSFNGDVSKVGSYHSLIISYIMWLILTYFVCALSQWDTSSALTMKGK